MQIPTFTAEGLRWRASSLETVERWLAEGRVVVKRDRHGRITCAQFRYGTESSPIRKSAHMGQRYSFLRVRGEVRVWEHKKLLPAQHIEFLMGEEVDGAVADLFVRAIFRAVPLSVMKGSRHVD